MDVKFNVLAKQVQVGHDVEFDVPVRGEPPPEKVWTFNEKTLDEPKIRVSLGFLCVTVWI